MIPIYPEETEITLDLRAELHPLFQQLPGGISEYTFANLFLFRGRHKYKISKFIPDSYLIIGQDQADSFFMLPFKIPDNKLLISLFTQYQTLKCVNEDQLSFFSASEYKIIEDRDNFDYLYSREALSMLSGRKYHKKRNQIKSFVNQHNYSGKPLLDKYLPDALKILEKWKEKITGSADYEETKEALINMNKLQLCGGIYYVDETPVAFSLGEELNLGKTFVIHFEKAIGEYKGLWQFINQAFASILPEFYEMINREQDLGEEGLRKAKLSYHPIDFVKKYKISRTK